VKRPADAYLPAVLAVTLVYALAAVAALHPSLRTFVTHRSRRTRLRAVRGIVGQSGGTIQVDSAPGDGTIFTVRFPLARVRSELLPERPALATLID
jgi:hypothetical protein